MTPEREFYVGYRRQAPPVLARFVGRVAALLIAAAVALAAVFVTAQDRFEPGVFEYGLSRHVAGVVRERPYPLLLVSRPGVPDGDHVSPFYLVAPGKRGAGTQVAGLDGRRARVRGTLVYREGETMLEIAAGGLQRGGVPAQPPALGAEDLGTHTLRGEIVDSKCFLGVMKPGRGTPHRACAVRCISGGIPPILRVETEGGEFRHFLLVDERGEAVNDRVLEVVAEPVEITGRVRREAGLLILEADPAAYRRLAG